MQQEITKNAATKIERKEAIIKWKASINILKCSYKLSEMQQ